MAALQSQCNIVPIIDNFEWPKAEELPEDMRAVCHFNGVRWIHDYQDACVDKLERYDFILLIQNHAISNEIPFFPILTYHLQIPASCEENQI